MDGRLTELTSALVAAAALITALVVGLRWAAKRDEREDRRR